MAINRRTKVLLLVLVVVWVIAIVVLVRMNSPEPVTAAVQPVQQPAALQNIQNTTNNTNLSTNAQVSNISLPDLQSILPDASFTNLFSPYVVTIPEELVGTDVIEDITSPQFKYVGYISFMEKGKEEKKVFILSQNQFISANENDLIESRYKPVIITSTYLVVLDTQDGRIKKISYISS